MQQCVERPDSWVTEEQFKAGLALIHAMPGPMFNLSAYLGAVIVSLARIPGLYLVTVLEEREVVERFGDEYLRYRDRVPGGDGTAYEGAVVAVDDAVGKLSRREIDVEQCELRAQERRRQSDGGGHDRGLVGHIDQLEQRVFRSRQSADHDILTAW